jgi:hypothetical protein
MIRYVTAGEVAALYRRPLGTVYRLASEHRWRRSTDHKRPVLYLAEDVAATFVIAH